MLAGMGGLMSACNFGPVAAKSLSDTVAFGSDANCGYRISSDGYVYTRQGLGSWVQGEKWKGSCANSKYQVRMTAPTGDAYSTTAGTSYLACSTTRTWELRNNNDSSTTSNSATLTIRRTSDNYVGVTKTITMQSMVNSP